jgi:hypothetical protein
VRVAFVVLVAACSYGEPDFSGTAFKCDATHGCPDDQRCIDGSCAALGSGADGVVCSATRTCDVGMMCCIDGTNPPRCLGISDRCPGRAALCDGVEDCDPGARCCDGARASCSSEVVCGAICRDGADCPGIAPNCCHDDPDVPWGHCNFSC